ncbi:MAG: putative ABC transporter permease [Clostridiales bacterium]|nr:putative ABC transporter permease [Clostridiales bacterium]
MEKKFAKDLHFFKIFWIFICAAFLGSLTQIILNSVMQRHFIVSSGVVYGWFSVFWGSCAVLVTLLFHKMKTSRDFILIILGMIVCGIYQYFFHMIQEHIFGMRFDAASKFDVFNGRVNMLSCIIGGILVMFWIKDIYPVISNLIERIPPVIGNIISIIAVLAMAANLLATGAAMVRMKERHINPAQTTPMEIYLDLQYPDTFLIERMPNLRMVEIPKWRDEIPIHWEE